MLRPRIPLPSHNWSLVRIRHGKAWHSFDACKYTHRDLSVQEPLLVILRSSSEDIAQQLSTDVSAPGLLVVHDTVGGGEDELAKGARREKIGCALLELTGTNVEAGRDDAGLVDASVQLHDDLPGAVVVDELELIDVAYKKASLVLVHKNTKL